jgi:CRP-like cAMP-binding protein
MRLGQRAQANLEARALRIALGRQRVAMLGRVVDLVDEGLVAADIAERLGVTRRTITRCMDCLGLQGVLPVGRRG